MAASGSLMGGLHHALLGGPGQPGETGKIEAPRLPVRSDPTATPLGRVDREREMAGIGVDRLDRHFAAPVRQALNAVASDAAWMHRVVRGSPDSFAPCRARHTASCPGSPAACAVHALTADAAADAGAAAPGDAAAGEYGALAALAGGSVCETGTGVTAG